MMMNDIYDETTDEISAESTAASTEGVLTRSKNTRPPLLLSTALRRSFDGIKAALRVYARKLTNSRRNEDNYTKYYLQGQGWETFMLKGAKGTLGWSKSGKPLMMCFLRSIASYPKTKIAPFGIAPSFVGAGNYIGNELYWFRHPEGSSWGGYVSVCLMGQTEKFEPLGVSIYVYQGLSLFRAASPTEEESSLLEEGGEWVWRILEPVEGHERIALLKRTTIVRMGAHVSAISIKAEASKYKVHAQFLAWVEANLTEYVLEQNYVLICAELAESAEDEVVARLGATLNQSLRNRTTRQVGQHLIRLASGTRAPTLLGSLATKTSVAELAARGVGFLRQLPWHKLRRRKVAEPSVEAIDSSSDDEEEDSSTSSTDPFIFSVTPQSVMVASAKVLGGVVRLSPKASRAIAIKVLRFDNWARGVLRLPRRETASTLRAHGPEIVRWYGLTIYTPLVLLSGALEQLIYWQFGPWSAVPIYLFELGAYVFSSLAERYERKEPITIEVVWDLVQFALIHGIIKYFGARFWGSLTEARASGAGFWYKVVRGFWLGLRVALPVIWDALTVEPLEEVVPLKFDTNFTSAEHQIIFETEQEAHCVHPIRVTPAADFFAPTRTNIQTSLAAYQMRIAPALEKVEERARAQMAMCKSHASYLYAMGDEFMEAISIVLNDPDVRDLHKAMASSTLRRTVANYTADAGIRPYFSRDALIERTEVYGMSKGNEALRLRHDIDDLTTNNTEPWCKLRFISIPSPINNHTLHAALAPIEGAIKVLTEGQGYVFRIPATTRHCEVYWVYGFISGFCKKVVKLENELLARGRHDRRPWRIVYTAGDDLRGGHWDGRRLTYKCTDYKMYDQSLSAPLLKALWARFIGPFVSAAANLAFDALFDPKSEQAPEGMQFTAFRKLPEGPAMDVLLPYLHAQISGFRGTSLMNSIPNFFLYFIIEILGDYTYEELGLTVTDEPIVVEDDRIMTLFLKHAFITEDDHVTVLPLANNVAKHFFVRDSTMKVLQKLGASVKPPVDTFGIFPTFPTAHALALFTHAMACNWSDIPVMRDLIALYRRVAKENDLEGIPERTRERAVTILRPWVRVHHGAYSPDEPVPSELWDWVFEKHYGITRSMLEANAISLETTGRVLAVVYRLIAEADYGVDAEM